MGPPSWPAVCRRPFPPPSLRLRGVTPAQWLGTACVLHASVVGAAWWHVSGGLLLGGHPGALAVALGRLVGLLVSSAVLLQLTLVSRLPWIEASVGCDRLFRWHRRLGFVIGSVILAHPTLLVFGYARRHHTSLSDQFMEIVRNWPYVWLAVIAMVVIVGAATLSTPILRRRLTYEAWHVSHLAMYAAVGFALLHQFNGAELTGQRWLAWYWVALYAFTIGCVAVFRAGRPILGFARHRFRIDKIVRESDDVCSVYLTGRRLDRFTFRSGQYANVAFLSKGLWAPHPFSFSAAPNGQFVRVSVKAVGDFTRRIHELTPGTAALIEGPLGRFTASTSRRDKYLMVAGGIGITPIRALIESLVGAHRDIVLLYAVRTARDLVFASELRRLTPDCHFILSQSDDVTDGHEHGRIDAVMLARLVPDARDREVFVCGPPPMMQAVIDTLRAAQIRGTQIHYERFA
ncbi:MAG TPA: ferredoxin reductase family protein [Vicinamibacterales bacterium]|nr:ferredoxin reductase family protein [Vicinamibacterales bacterium]